MIPRDHAPSRPHMAPLHPPRARGRVAVRRVLKWCAIVVAILIGLDLIVLHAPASLGSPHAFAVPSSSSAPTLHCARPAPGCRWASSDRVLTVGWGVSYGRGDVVVFKTPPKAMTACGEGGLYIKRI